MKARVLSDEALVEVVVDEGFDGALPEYLVDGLLAH